MTNEQFAALVGRLEQRALEHPGRYRLQVLLLALLGNAYLTTIVLLILAVLVVLGASVLVLKALAVKLFLIVAVFLWMVIKSLQVRVEPPQGTPVDGRQAPELHALIDALRQRLAAPRFHHVLITDEFNAGVAQVPRLGIFGWYRNYLLIGLPLMKALTVDQLKAVLAHEFGHLAKGHGRMSNWIYRLRQRWSRLLTVLDATESGGRFLFKPFLKWFAPYFNAYSFPLARANEYQADATAVALTSAPAAAAALTGVNVVGSYLAQRYWPEIHRHADLEPRPSFTPFNTMGRGLAAELDHASVAAWLDEAMAAETDLADTHPALADRLRAIGEAPRLALPADGEAADRLLGSALASITQAFDGRWREGIAAAWEEHYERTQERRRRYAELTERHASGVLLTPPEAYDRAMLTESIGEDPNDALRQLHALHQRVPDSPVVCFALGDRLLGSDDQTACALLEEAMRLDEGATVRVCEVLRDHHWRNGRKEEAHTWHQRMVKRSELEQAAAAERAAVRLRDKLEHHGLADEVVDALRAALKSIPGVRRAYLVKKQVAHLPDSPCYVLGFRIIRSILFARKRRRLEIQGQIQESVSFPGETFILSVEGANYRFGRKLWRIRGARIL